MTSIGSFVFFGCSGLTSITIPDSVTNIGQYAFNGCTGLTSVTISDNITRINDSLFGGCKQLKSITIPKSVTKIGYSAFWGCSGLTITFNGTMAEWKAIDKESKWKYANSRFTIHCTDGDLKE